MSHVSLTAGTLGQRLLPQTIDLIAEEDPDAPWASLPRNDNDLSQGFVDISYASFAEAINQMSWFIHEELGPSETCEAIAYLGTPDIRYHILAMAAAKTGYQVLFSTHLNSPVGHVSLMKQCNCKALLTASGAQVDNIIPILEIPHLLVPEPSDLLPPSQVPHYPFDKSFSEMADTPFVILHTSGSTGLPKPLPITHRYCAAYDAQKLLPDVDEARPNFIRLRTVGRPDVGTRIFCPFFPFHVIALTIMLMSSVWGGSVYVPGFSTKITNAEDSLDVIEYGSLDSAFVSPAMLEAWSGSDRAMQLISQLKNIHYGGGKLSLSTGKIISSKTWLINLYGATETSMPVLYQVPREDWEYLSFDRVSSGFDFRPLDGNLHELVIVRKPDWSMQAVFATRPGIQEWETHDLYQKHPTREDTWKFDSRTDDLICFKHGNKFNPSPYEDKYIDFAKAKGLDVRAAVLVGDERNQCVLLVEATKNLDRERIWEVVQKVNQVAPSVGEVDQEHIHVISPGNKGGFVRTAKGTVSRRATIEIFKKEIDGVYRTFGDHSKIAMPRVS